MSKKKKRKTILHYADNWGNGGIESFVMNLMRVAALSDIHFEIVTAWSDYDGYDQEIKELGSTRRVLSKFKPATPLSRARASIRLFSKFIQENYFDVIHLHVLNGVMLKNVQTASKCSAYTIVHSHNTDFADGNRQLKKIAHHFAASWYSSKADMRVACSEEAGKYMFAKSDFSVVPNGIQSTRFMYDKSKRREFRSALGLEEDAYIAGTVGRFHYQKNPHKVLEIAAELLKRDVIDYFLWVGTGPLFTEIESIIQEKKLGKKIILLGGDIKAIEEVYFSMDFFILPSLYEGLSIAAIEAQATGLPCLLSASQAREVDINANKIDFLDTERLDDWTTSGDSFRNLKYDRNAAKSALERTMYSFPDCFHSLISCYCEHL